MALAFRDWSIWKYEFPITDRFSLPLPKGARVLTAQMQGDTPCLWAEVDREADPVARRFYIVGTGNPSPECVGMRYVATFQQGRFVWHLYEEPA